MGRTQENAEIEGNGAVLVAAESDVGKDPGGKNCEEAEVRCSQGELERRAHQRCVRPAIVQGRGVRERGVLLLGSGLLSMIALSRAGVRHFWAPQGRTVPRLRVVEGAPIAALLVACAVLTVRADAAVRYAQATAYGVLDPARYIDAVMSATPAPAPVRSSVAGHGGR